MKNSCSRYYRIRTLIECVFMRWIISFQAISKLHPIAIYLSTTPWPRAHDLKGVAETAGQTRAPPTICQLEPATVAPLPPRPYLVLTSNPQGLTDSPAYKILFAGSVGGKRVGGRTGTESDLACDATHPRHLQRPLVRHMVLPPIGS